MLGGRLLLGLIAALIVSLGMNREARAATHVALVIGNGAYQSQSALPNPVNDASDMAQELTRIGYEVTPIIDADYATLRQALGEFAEKAANADVALVFYAGHGIEVDKRNYLIPVDAKLKTDRQVQFEAIALDDVLSAIADVRELGVVFLDACRDNPFLAQMKRRSGAQRSVSRGLAPVEPDAGLLVGFAAREGTTASDGDGRNSPYTTALLKRLAEPDLDVGRMFRQVRDDVKTATGNRQEPFEYGSLPGRDVFLFPGSENGAPPKPVTPVETPVASGPDRSTTADDEAARAAFTFLRESDGTCAEYDVFIERFADTIWADFARQTRKRMTCGTDVASVPPVTPPQVEAPAAEPQQWFLATYRDVDLFGGDIMSRGVEARSLSECSSQCGDNLSCRAFTYNAAAKRCFLKSGYDYVQIVEGVTSGFYYQSTASAPPPRFRADWEVFLKSDLTGDDLNSRSAAASYDGCQEACRGRSDCGGFAFVHFTKPDQCWLKGGFSLQPFTNRNALRGVTAARKVSREITPADVVIATQKN
jgi:uncharacterized caspase-like protein